MRQSVSGKDCGFKVVTVKGGLLSCLHGLMSLSLSDRINVLREACVPQLNKHTCTHSHLLSVYLLGQSI